MTPWSWISQYAVAVVAFTVLDLIWLGTVAKDLYAAHIGHLLAPKANLPAAVAFYVIFLAGLVYFVIHPAIAEGSWTKAAVAGAAFGFVTYATWDLTNLAVLKDFPLSIVPIDMAWGTFLAAAVSTATYGVAHLIPTLR
jgi:uncharacterized membrane protein